MGRDRVGKHLALENWYDYNNSKESRLQDKKKFIRNKEKHLMNITGLIPLEDIITQNLYVLNNKA